MKAGLKVPALKASNSPAQYGAGSRVRQHMTNMVSKDAPDQRNATLV
jgi:hypothetical protein